QVVGGRRAILTDDQRPTFESNLELGTERRARPGLGEGLIQYPDANECGCRIGCLREGGSQQEQNRQDDSHARSPCYSTRSAMWGCRRVARRAGTSAATTMSVKPIAAAATVVVQLPASTRNTRLCSHIDSHRPARRPTRAPVAAATMASRTTRAMMWVDGAPTAMRIAISRVRHATMNT